MQNNENTFNELKDLIVLLKVGNTNNSKELNDIVTSNLKDYETKGYIEYIYKKGFLGFGAKDGYELTNLGIDYIGSFDEKYNAKLSDNEGFMEFLDYESVDISKLVKSENDRILITMGLVYLQYVSDENLVKLLQEKRFLTNTEIEEYFNYGDIMEFGSLINY